eukprot:maker-scaffold969_size75217-snap-gene-0.12 protein:Tk04950 transcript:maker-scaffold969_size75217-snap-gene-0.12-mRNA-1 annotation:"hypothetical protein DAPPUDRAFT_303790"
MRSDNEAADVTVTILACAIILISAYDLIDSSGSAISCQYDKNLHLPDNLINRYCWAMSTFSLPQHYQGIEGEDYIYPGVGPHMDDDERTYHAYYQWVPLFLTFQLACFYAPHWIWKNWDGDRMGKCLKDNVQADELSKYLYKAHNSVEIRRWGLKYFACEFLNLINVIWQIIFTDIFLAGEFRMYGISALSFVLQDPEDRVDPMSLVFPKMTKCIFHKYGGSGTIMRFDALCVLGMNILSEKVFIFLWFWYIILALITIVGIIQRLLQVCIPSYRIKSAQRARPNSTRLNKLAKESDVIKQYCTTRSSFGDWLLLQFVSQNVSQGDWESVVNNLYKSFTEGSFSIKKAPSDEVQNSEERKELIEKEPMDFENQGFSHTPKGQYSPERKASDPVTQSLYPNVSTNFEDQSPYATMESPKKAQVSAKEELKPQDEVLEDPQGKAEHQTDLMMLDQEEVKDDELATRESANKVKVEEPSTQVEASVIDRPLPAPAKKVLQEPDDSPTEGFQTPDKASEKPKESADKRAAEHKSDSGNKIIPLNASSPTSLLVNGIVTVGSDETAQAMNHFFSDKVDKLYQNLALVSSPPGLASII